MAVLFTNYHPYARLRNKVETITITEMLYDPVLFRLDPVYTPSKTMSRYLYKRVYIIYVNIFSFKSIMPIKHLQVYSLLYIFAGEIDKN